MHGARGLAVRLAPRLLTPPRRRGVAVAMAMTTGDRMLQTAVVRAVDGDPNLTITLSLAGKMRYMSRPKTEPLDKTLDRMARSAAPKPDKKRAKASAASAASLPPPPAPPSLLPAPDAAAPVPGATPNGAAWTQGAVLSVGGERYAVVVNPPTILKASLNGAPIAGCPLAPALDLAFADRGACRYAWQRRKGGPPSPGASAPIPQPPAAADDGWEPVPGDAGAGPSYTPTRDDVGWTLRVVVTPGAAAGGPGPGPRLGAPAAATAAGPVEPGPPARPADGRADAVPTPTTPPRLRVVTYNLLADQYAATGHAQTVLFGHCPPHHLDAPYRRSLAAAELTAYAGDVVCLQEVDEKAFDGVLVPVLGAAGYAGRYTNKASSVREGSALFWRESRFELVDWRDVTLRDVFAAVLAGAGEGGGGDAGGPAALALAARHGGLLPVLRSSAWLRDALAKVSTVAQVALLAPKAEGGGGGGGGGGDPPPRDLDAPLVVTNTHLFFHPAAPHIRTLHVAAMLTEAADVAARAVAAGRVGEAPVPLFCGDLNSDLNDGVPGTVELLREGVLSSGFWDWRLGAAFRYDRDGVADAEPGSPLPPPDPSAPSDGLAPVDLALPFRLAPADGLATPFTNWVRGYGGLLDYVWTDDRALAPVGGPPPPCHLLGPDTFLPSATFPSDHLAVVADLEFRPPAARAAAAADPPRADPRAPRGAPPPPFKPPAAGGPPTKRVTATDPDALSTALLALRSGALAVVPTDTLYGVAADAASPSAVAAVYAAKGRDGGAPLAVAVGDVSDVGAVGDASALPAGLLEALLPGPVTVLLARRADAPLTAALNPGVATIGVRVPDSPFVRALARAHGGPLALTSANASGEPAALEVGEAAAVAPAAAVVVDGGRVGGGGDGRAGSTVVDLSAAGAGVFTVLREGDGADGVREALSGAGLKESV